MNGFYWEKLCHGRGGMVGVGKRFGGPRGKGRCLAGKRNARLSLSDDEYAFIDLSMRYLICARKMHNSRGKPCGCAGKRRGKGGADLVVAAAVAVRRNGDRGRGGLPPSRQAPPLKQMHSPSAEGKKLREGLSDDTRAIVKERLGRIPDGLWREAKKIRAQAKDDLSQCSLFGDDDYAAVIARRRLREADALQEAAVFLERLEEVL